MGWGVDPGLGDLGRAVLALDVLDEQQVRAHGTGLDEAEKAEPQRQCHQVDKVCWRHGLPRLDGEARMLDDVDELGFRRRVRVVADLGRAGRI